MGDLRKEFEGSYHINSLINLCCAEYNELTRNYIIKSNGLYDQEVCSFINGAWYAFQEQQEKIDAALTEVDRLKVVTGLNCLEKVKELLK